MAPPPDDEYEALKETAEILSDPDTLAAIGDRFTGIFRWLEIGSGRRSREAASSAVNREGVSRDRRTGRPWNAVVDELMGAPVSIERGVNSCASTSPSKLGAVGFVRIPEAPAVREDSPSVTMGR